MLAIVINSLYPYGYKPIIMNATQQYLKNFFAEKEIDKNRTYEIDDKYGFTHIFTNEVVIDRIMNTSDDEQKQIAHVLRQIDFRNGSVQHFLKYLASAMVLQWSAAA